jgi:hypothetical protein
LIPVMLFTRISSGWQRLGALRCDNCNPT